MKHSLIDLARAAVHRAEDADDLDLALDRLCALAAVDAVEDVESRLEEIRAAVDGLESEAATILQAWHFRAVEDAKRDAGA